MSFLRAAPWCALCACVFFVTPAPASTSGAVIHAEPRTAAEVAAVLQPSLRRAWEASPQVQLAEAELRAARARASAAAQPVYNPSIQIDGENADVDRRTAGVSLTLDMSGKRQARVAESDAETRAREAALLLARRDTAAAWLKAWAGVSLAEEQSAMGSRRMALMRRFDDLAAKGLRVGDISLPERDLASLALGEAAMQQATLLGQEAALRGALAAVAGGDTARLPPFPHVLPPEADSVQPVTTEQRPLLLRTRAERDRADAGVTVARRARAPDPTVSLTGGRVRSGTRTDRVVGISVSIPLPVRNTGRADIAAAQADADAAFASHRAASMQADAGLVQARATYVALRDAMAVVQQGRAAALDERSRTLEKLWQAGEIDTTDYLTQLKQGLDTALGALALESQAWQAWFDYLAAAGRLTDWIQPSPEETSP